MAEYVCAACRAQFSSYGPRCAACGSWSTLRLDAPGRLPGVARFDPQPSRVNAPDTIERTPSPPEPVPSTTADVPAIPRLLTGWRELDLTLGGDLTPGFAATATYLLTGDPGSGKSALSVDVASRVALRHPGLSVLYVIVERSLEELVGDVRRLEAERPNLLLLHAVELDVILSVARAKRLSLLVIDSLQPLAAHTHDIPRVAGAFRELSIELRIPTLLISRLNARGLALGPNDTRHDVGAELSVAWDEGSAERALVVKKNRFGPSSSSERPPLYLRMNTRGRLMLAATEEGAAPSGTTLALPPALS